MCAGLAQRGALAVRGLQRQDLRRFSQGQWRVWVRWPLAYRRIKTKTKTKAVPKKTEGFFAETFRFTGKA